MMKLMFFALAMRLVFSQIEIDQELNKGIILSQMKELGSKVVRFKLCTRGAVKNQFLVAAVVTESMLKDPKLLQLTRGCPITQTQVNEQLFSKTSVICATSAVVFNRVDEKILERSPWSNNKAYKKHSWHGEYMFLKEDIFKTLTNRFKAIGSNERCQTFLYSYFIPCKYNSKKQPYNCTGELSGYDGTNDKCPITVIGYTSVHPATANNLEATKEALSQKYELVQLVEKKTKETDEKAFEISTQVIKFVQKQTATFQEVFYECLLYSPIEHCCIDSAKNYDRRNQVVAFYLNEVVRNFVETSNFKGYRGKISDLDSYLKGEAEKEFLEFATKNLSNECNSCLYKRVSLYVNYCTKKAFDMTNFFGTPDYYPAPPLLHQPVWKQYEGIWQNMYIRVRKNERSLAQCIRELRQDTLCTAKSSKIPKLEECRPE